MRLGQASGKRRAVVQHGRQRNAISDFSCICFFGGQLRLVGAAQKCLSVKGLAAGTNVALKSAISASSSADTGAHGASMAVDGNSNTFWAHEDRTCSCTVLALHFFVDVC